MKLRPKLVLPRADTHDDHQPSETRPEQEQTPPDGPSIVDILEDAKNHLSGTRYRGGDLSFPENFRLTGNGVVPRKTSRSALRHYDLGEKLPFPLTHLRHARHQGHRVIIKTVHRPSRDDRGPLNNAIKEVAVGIRLRQQHCRHEAGAHRLIMTDDEAYIIAREVGTENLARLCFRMNCGEAISSKDALRLARDLTEFVLDMVRLGYAHNDFHGNNIRIYQTEKGLRAKIIDFELASPFDPKGRKVDIGKLGNHLATLFEGMANTPSDLAERVDEHIKEALRAHTQEAVEASLSALNRMLKAAYRECARTTT